MQCQQPRLIIAKSMQDGFSMLISEGNAGSSRRFVFLYDQVAFCDSVVPV